MEYFYDYYIWLIGLSILFAALEWWHPANRRPLLRRGIWMDIFYILFNSKYFGFLLGWLLVYCPWLDLVQWFDRVLNHFDWKEKFYRNVFSEQPLWLQILVVVLVMDFCKYIIHNLLHRIPWLWEFHKVHHSIVDLDWIGNWRFHWFEAIFYNSLLYIPAIFFGFSPYAMFWYGIIGTVVGHFAHANLDVSIGPLKYVINSPKLHVWHHIHADYGPINKNFGVVLSLWDWIFGTAYLPTDKQPLRLGFVGMEKYPGNLWLQLVVPFSLIKKPDAPNK